MDYNRTTIKCAIQKRYFVLGKGYARLSDAAKALAKHRMLHRFFEYDEENNRFVRGSNDKMIPTWELMCLQVGVEEFSEFQKEEDFEKAMEGAQKDWICFNYGKWKALVEQEKERIINEYKTQPQQKD